MIAIEPVTKPFLTATSLSSVTRHVPYSRSNISDKYIWSSTIGWPMTCYETWHNPHWLNLIKVSVGRGDPTERTVKELIKDFVLNGQQSKICQSELWECPSKESLLYCMVSCSDRYGCHNWGKTRDIWQVMRTHCYWQWQRDAHRPIESKLPADFFLHIVRGGLSGFWNECSATQQSSSSSLSSFITFMQGIYTDIPETLFLGYTVLQ